MEKADFVVIGGGIAGVSAGYFLAERGSVILLEREATCGYHSTGRSAAVFTECYGDEVVRRLAVASRAFLETAAAELAGNPVLTPRSLMFIGRADQSQALDATYEMARSLVPDVELIDADGVRERCPVVRDGYAVAGVLEPASCDIDVHALLEGFTRGLRKRGGRVMTGAMVETIGRVATGWRLTAGDLTVEAPVVVNAAGAWCDLVAAMAGVVPLGLGPMRRTAFTFAPPSGLDAAGWPLVIDAGEEFYFKPEGPLLLASPADETPMAPGDVRHEEIDVAIAIDRIKAATTLDVRHVQNAWAGLRSFVGDRRPVAGFDSDVDGFFWLAGQGGYGIKTSPAMGLAAAGLIADGALPPTLGAAGVSASDLSPQRLR